MRERLSVHQIGVADLLEERAQHTHPVPQARPRRQASRQGQVRHPGGTSAVDEFAAALSGVEGVARVDAATGRYAGGTLVAPADPTLDRFGAGASAGGDATWPGYSAGRIACR